MRAKAEAVYNALSQVGEMITKAPTRNVADALLYAFRVEMAKLGGVWIAEALGSYIWDYMVNWDQVTWKEAEG